MKGIEQFLQVDAATLGALKYAGTWNASTNTPTLASGVGVQGQYYVVSVAGSTNLDGVTNWGVGDWAVFNGSVWQRVEGGADGNFVNLSVTGTATVSGTAEFADGLAASPSITNIGDTNTGMYFPSADAIGIVTGGVNRIRITSAGDVGIGTTTPAVKLDVANGFVVVGANSANPGVGGNIRFRDDTGASRWLNGLLGGAAATAYSIYDLVAGAERLNISSTGDVGIGTSSPAVKLDVSGTINANSSLLIGSTYGVLYGDTGNSLIIGADNGNTGASTRLQFNVDGTERMRIDSAGNVGIGTSSPAYKLDVVGNARFTGAITTTANTDALVMGSGTGTSTRVNLYFNGTDAAGSARVNYIGTNISGTAGNLEFFCNVTGLLGTWDTSGNLGIGVTPSAWATVLPVLQANNASFTGYNNQAILSSNWYYNAGNKYITTGYATQYSQSSGSHIWFTAPSGTAGNAISFTQAMTLDASGNLLVGKTSPTYSASNRNVFEINGTDSSIVAMQYGGANGAYFQLNSTAWYAWNSGNTPMVFATNNIERARIDASGNLGVGVTDPDAPVTIQANSGANAIRIRGRATGNLSYLVFRNNANSADLGVIGSGDAGITFDYGGTERARIPAAGGMVVGTAALATTATDGFLYVPTCAGTPTGTPTTQTGTAPIVIDTTNNKLYFYSGGQWRDAGP